MKRSVKIPLVAAATAFVAVALLTPVGVRLAIHAGLRSAGFSQADGGDVSLGLHRIQIAGLRPGPKSAVTVSATYSFSSLLHGRVRTVDLSDVRLHGVVGLNGAVALDGFTPPASSTTDTGPLSLPADSVTIRDATLVLDTPAGDVLLAANGELAAVDGGLRLTGTATLKHDAVTGTAPIDFALMAGGWTVSLNPIHLEFAGKPDDGAPAQGHLTLAKTADAPVTGDMQLDGQNLRLAGVPVRTLSFGFKTGADGLSATLKLVPAGGGAGVDGIVKSGADGVTANLTASVADVAPIATAMGWAAVSGPVKASLTLTVAPAEGARPLALDLAYDGAAPGGIVLRGARLQEAASYEGAANALTLTSCGAFSADSMILAGTSLVKLSGCLGPKEGRPAFIQDASGDQIVAGAVSNLAASIVSGAQTLAEIKIPSAQAALSLGDSGLTGLDTQIDGATLNLPALGAGVQGLSAKLIADDQGKLSGSLSGRLAAGAPNSPSLPVTGTVGGTLADGPTAALTLGSIVKGSVAGKTAKIDMPATEIGEGGVDLLRLMPGLATSASKLSGNLAFHAEADWSGAKMVSKGSLTLKNVAATTPNFTVDGVNTSISLLSLNPLTIAEKQKLTTGTLMAGVPLTDGEVIFSLTKSQMLNLDSACWTVAGGTIGTYDQHLDLYGPDQNLGLVVKDVDLAEVLKLLNVNGLSAEGKLVGTIPLRHTKDTILVQHGYLQTRAEGVIRYDPADTPSFLQGQPGEGTAILRDALKDFHYQQLGVTIDGVLGGEQQIKMSLKGANPKLYGGLPVSLNVNLTGALDSIARSSVEAYTHPTETVRKKLNTKTGETK